MGSLLGFLAHVFVVKQEVSARVGGWDVVTSWWRETSEVVSESTDVGGGKGDCSWCSVAVLGMRQRDWVE